jgi:glycolate oxidase iron-sulfur subunit
MSISSSHFQYVKEEDLNTCVNCGLCLPHCPTYRVTGEDIYSPRGRINLIRSVKHGDMELTKEVVNSLDTCIQCMGCEPACPSGVQYHNIISPVKTEIHQRRNWRDIPLRFGLYVVTHLPLLRLLTRIISVFQLLKAVPKRLQIPRIPFRRQQLLNDPHLSREKEVMLFTGCVMDAWYRNVHEDTITLLNALGYSVVISGDEYGCCGALHEHAGFTKTAEKIQGNIPRSTGNATIIVNSAGCSASLKKTLKDSREVLDINEFLYRHISDLRKLLIRRKEKVIIQEPCHLRHVQGISLEVTELLGIAFDVVQLDDDGLCCGAGGSFSFSQPEMANAVRGRKIAEITRVIESISPDSVRYVASANPGCLSFLSSSAINIEIQHPVTLLTQSLRLQNLTGGPQ